MSRFFRLLPYARVPLFVMAAANLAKHRKNNDTSKRKETETDKSNLFAGNLEKWCSSADAASQVSDVLPEIRELRVDQLLDHLNYWQDSHLSAEALYEKTSGTQFKPVRAECYNDCIIAFMQLQEFRRKYKAQLHLTSCLHR